MARASERVKKSPIGKNISRKDAKARRRKENKGIILCDFCAFARNRIFFHTFSRPCPVTAKMAVVRGVAWAACHGKRSCGPATASDRLGLPRHAIVWACHGMPQGTPWRARTILLLSRRRPVLLQLEILIDLERGRARVAMVLPVFA